MFPSIGVVDSLIFGNYVKNTGKTLPFFLQNYEKKTKSRINHALGLHTFRLSLMCLYENGIVTGS